jgi:hypothetical protein
MTQHTGSYHLGLAMTHVHQQHLRDERQQDRLSAAAQQAGLLRWTLRAAVRRTLTGLGAVFVAGRSPKPAQTVHQETEGVTL